ncbi:MAG: ribosome maturation factor RimP [Gammaproteobacteria bacterium]|jgi:ribosome maturation factor RimP|nr:ribosome maturation factor RimP [Gammaproteobacteria bacterium]
MTTVRDTLYEVVTPVVEGLGYELVGIEYIPQGKHSLLRIYIDQPSGITLDDCEKVSHQLSAVMDVEDPLGHHYNLEISSPGLERPLFIEAHYIRFSGEQVFVRMAFPLEGRRKFEGLLKGVEEGEVLVEIGDELFRLPLSQVDKAHLVPEYT